MDAGGGPDLSAKRLLDSPPVDHQNSAASCRREHSGGCHREVAVLGAMVLQSESAEAVG